MFSYEILNNSDKGDDNRYGYILNKINKKQN